ncbi:hypothetical protein ACFL6Y_10520, partial [Elusimicrobiota bacterium]
QEYDYENFTFSKLRVYDGKLYASGHSVVGGDVRVYEDDSWDNLVFETGDDYCQGLTVFNGKLYAATRDDGAQGHVFGYDGSEWRLVYSASEDKLAAIAGFNNKLYVGSHLTNGVIYEFTPFSVSMSVADGESPGTLTFTPGDDLFELYPSTHDAQNQVKFFASDTLGNVSAAGPFNVLIDASSPTYSDFKYYREDGAEVPTTDFLNTSSPTFTIVVADALSGLSTDEEGGKYPGSPQPAMYGIELSSDGGATWRAIAASTIAYASDAGHYLGLEVFNGDLYAGSYGKVLNKYDGVSWSTPVADATQSIFYMTTYRDKLYLGMATGRVGVYDESEGSVVISTMMDAAPAQAVDALTVYNGKLYAGNDRGISAYDGYSWSRSTDWTSNYFSMRSLSGYLYIGGNSPPGLRYDGASWTTLTGRCGSSLIEGMAVYKGILYHGTSGVKFADILGDNSSCVTTPGLAGQSLGVHRGVLYVGSLAAGGRLFSYDGTLPVVVSEDSDRRAEFATYKGDLYTGGNDGIIYRYTNFSASIDASDGDPTGTITASAYADPVLTSSDTHFSFGNSDTADKNQVKFLVSDTLGNLSEETQNVLIDLSAPKPPVFAEDPLGTWTSANNTGLADSFGPASMVYNGRIYLLGGDEENNTGRDTYFWADVNKDGTLSDWTESAAGALEEAALHQASVVYNGKVYIIGGKNAGGDGISENVYYYTINADKTLSAGTQGPSIPVEVRLHEAAVVEAPGAPNKAYVYVMGGQDGSAVKQDVVYRSSISADGSLGQWFPDQSLPEVLTQFAVVVNNGKIYAIGGTDSSRVYYSQVHSDGTLGNWVLDGNTLPGVTLGHGAAVVNNKVYVVGNTFAASLYYASINADGSLGSWTDATSTSGLPGDRANFALITSNNKLYVIGGNSAASTFHNTVYTASVPVSGITAYQGEINITGLTGPADQGGLSGLETDPTSIGLFTARECSGTTVADSDWFDNTTYDFTSLSGNTSYYLSLRARDKATNISTNSCLGPYFMPSLVTVDVSSVDTTTNIEYDTGEEDDYAAVLKIVMNSEADGLTRLRQAKAYFIGTSTPSDVKTVRLYKDNDNGVFDILEDDDVSPVAAFVGSTATMLMAGTDMNINTTATTFFMVLSMKETALPRRTIGLQVDADSFVFARQSDGDTVSSAKGQAMGNVPYNSHLIDIDDPPSLILVNSTSIAPETTFAGELGVGMLRFSLHTTSNTAELERIIVHNDNPNDASSVHIYRDNGDLVFDGDDTKIGTGNFSADPVKIKATTVTFSSPATYEEQQNLSILRGTGATFYVVYDINSGASNLDVIMASITAIPDQIRFRVAVDYPTVGGFPLASTRTIIYASDAQIFSERSSYTWYGTPDFVFSSNLGAQGVNHIHYFFDTSPTHTWGAHTGHGCSTDGCHLGSGEYLWGDGVITTHKATATAASNSDSWYLHIIPYTVASEAGVQRNIGPFYYDGTDPGMSGFQYSKKDDSYVAEGVDTDTSTPKIQIVFTDNDNGAGLSIDVSSFTTDRGRRPGFGVALSNNGGSTWMDFASSTGVYDGPATRAMGFLEYNGILYAGEGTSGTDNDGNVIMYDGSSWSVSHNEANGRDYISNFAEFNGILYASIGGVSVEGDILMCDPAGGVSSTICDRTEEWNDSFNSSDAGATYHAAYSLQEYNGKLYASFSGIDGGDIWVCDPGDDGVCGQNDWSIDYDTVGLGYSYAFGLGVYNGKLYAGFGHPTNAGKGDVFVSTGGAWSMAFDGAEKLAINMAVYDGKLYVAQGANTSNQAAIHSYDGNSSNTWVKSIDFSDGSCPFTSNRVGILYVFEGRLYAGTGFSPDVGSIYAYDGGSWRLAYESDGSMTASFGAYNGKLYAGFGGSVYDIVEFTPFHTSAGEAVDSDTTATLDVYLPSSNITLFPSTYTVQNQVRVFASNMAGLVSSDTYNISIENDAPTISSASFKYYFSDGTDATGQFTDTSSPTITIDMADAMSGLSISEAQASVLQDGPEGIGFGVSVSSDGGEGWVDFARSTISYYGSQEGIYSLEVYKGKLYASQGHWSDVGDIHSFNGDTWTELFYDGPASSDRINDMEVYKDKLYAGGKDASGNAQILVCDEAGCQSNHIETSGTRTMALQVYNGKLYAGIGTTGAEGNVIVYDGTRWQTSYQSGIERVESLGVYKGKLYAGLGYTEPTAGDIMVFDGFNWTLSRDDSTAPGDGYSRALCFAEYNGKLYAGMGGIAGDGDILVYNGISWGTSYDATTGLTVWDMQVFNGKLYAVGKDDAQGGAVLLGFDGTNWRKVFSRDAFNMTDPDDPVQELYFMELAAYNGKLYASGYCNTLMCGDVYEFTPFTGSVNAADGETASKTMTISLYADPLGQDATAHFSLGNSTYSTRNRIKIFASDMLGNVGSVGPYDISVDISPPLAPTMSNYSVGGSWSLTGGSYAREYGDSVLHNGRIYVLGGTGSSGAVNFAKINPDGTVSGWTATTALPVWNGATVFSDQSAFGAVVYNNRIYVIGGGNPQRDGTAYAQINDDGSLGSWTQGTRLPAARTYHSVVEHNGKIYAIGGWVGSDYNGVHFSQVNPDGTLGDWIETTPMPQVSGRWNSSFVHNNRIYVLGGYAALNKAYYAQIKTDGTLGAWTQTTQLPAAVTYRMQSAVVNNTVYVVGNNNDPNGVYYNSINADGSLGGAWTQATDLNHDHTNHSALVHAGRIYVIGGTGADQIEVSAVTDPNGPSGAGLSFDFSAPADQTSPDLSGLPANPVSMNLYTMSECTGTALSESGWFSGTTYSFSDLTGNTSYYTMLRAIDNAGNISSNSCLGPYHMPTKVYV